MLRYIKASLIGLIAGALAFGIMVGTEASQSVYYSDDEIARGFALSVFGSEFSDGHVQEARVRKFTTPVKFYIENASQSHSGEVIEFLHSLRKFVPSLRFLVTDDPDLANYRIHLLDPNGLGANYLERRGSLSSQMITSGGRSDIRCFGEAAINAFSEILYVDVYIPMYADYRERRSCIVEEILQGLGPMNDSDFLPHSIFNDANNDSVFDLTTFDLYILNMLYHPAVRAGMPQKQVMPILSSVLPIVKRMVH